MFWPEVGTPFDPRHMGKCDIDSETVGIENVIFVLCAKCATKSELESVFLFDEGILIILGEFLNW